ncbi:MAG: type II toxin-antitoxin system RatA family toxin [Rickettsiales bacterium]
MPRVSYNISSLHKVENLFNLVADVESYPNFLPWCSATRIIKQEEKELIAELLIRYKFFSSSYVSKIILTPSKEIIVELVDGPFKHLYNKWEFTEQNNKSQIEFILDFELKSPILEGVIKQNINSYAKKMLDAFIKRADALFITK